MEQSPTGEWMELRSGKITTRGGALRAELIPTPKLLPQLRGLFPQALIVGWKFEVDGARSQAIERAQSQIQASRSDACVVNGAAYGDGFGILQPSGEIRHSPDSSALFQDLATLVAQRSNA